MIERLIKGDYAYKGFSSQFLEKYKLVEDECPPEDLAGIAKLCSKYLSQDVSEVVFFQELKKQYIYIEEVYNFERE